MANLRLLPRVLFGCGVIRYPIGVSGQFVVFDDAVLDHFRHHRQLHRRDQEAGGQLFAQFDPPHVMVVEATGPRPTDVRTPTAYLPDRAAEQTEIEARTTKGLIWVGDWHTHFQARPRASKIDVISIMECSARSSHRLNGLMLVVVGLEDPPHGLYVAVYDAHGGCRLFPEVAAVTINGTCQPSNVQNRVTAPPRRASQ